MNPHRFKTLLQRRHCQFGLFCVSNALQTAEALAHSGFDFIVFDMEHSPQSLPHMHAQLAALAVGHSAAIVRVPGLELATFKHCLDLGVQAIMVPNINSAREAAQAVSFSYYPPDGVRGLGGTMRATRYGRDADYVKRANAQACVIVQIESRAGLAALDEICAVPGIDMVFFGPADLAVDMGHPGQSTHPEVVQAIESGIRKAQHAGVAAGVMAQGPQAAAYAQAGATVVILGSDLGLMVRAADTLAQQHVQAPARFDPLEKS